ncbi:MAG: tRNA lysidine(34) synthetase TilS [Chitinophagales bacterium]|nr:tRNA lysidine(34) synthetase TilS [Chitinophagales bacterium]
MNFLNKFTDNWTKNFKNIVPPNAHLFIAVSGGIDSVVLTDLIAKLPLNFTILHCNFQLREEESRRDELFVQSLEKKYNQKVVVKSFNTKQFAEENKISIQLAARELRYNWFNEILQTNKKNEVQSFLLTAHHADDNIETVFMNICRGTGIKGLHGISLKLNNILRPLLFARRTEIIAYAKQEKIEWVEDSSNSSIKYARNFFRHQIIPLIKNIYTEADKNILENIERWKEVELIYNKHINDVKQKLLLKKGNEIHIPILKLKQQTALSTLLLEIITAFGFTAAQLTDVLQLLDANSSKYISSSTHRIIKNRKWLLIVPLQNTDATHYIIEEQDSSVNFSNKLLQLKVLDSNKINTEPSFACIDFNKLQFPLILRKWQQGDYFYPLGMLKKKKLTRFFIDLKLSATEKENIWVVETNKKIIWVVGYRIDERFKVQNTTKTMLQMTVQ